MKDVEVQYHRNGVGGEGFYVAKFDDSKRPMVAVVFEGTGQVAVFDRELLADGNITFGENSWRGSDNYETELREAIAAWDWKDQGQPHALHAV